MEREEHPRGRCKVSMVSEQDEVYEKELCTNTENAKEEKLLIMTILAVTEDGSLCLGMTRLPSQGRVDEQSVKQRRSRTSEL
jgi:hypothetical protein